MLLFQPIVAKSALIDLYIIFIENRSLAPHNEEKCINIKLTLLGQGGAESVSDGYLSMKKGVWRSKIS